MSRVKLVLYYKVVNVGLEAEIKTSFMQYAMSIILVSHTVIAYAFISSQRCRLGFFRTKFFPRCLYFGRPLVQSEQFECEDNNHPAYCVSLVFCVRAVKVSTEPALCAA